LPRLISCLTETQKAGSLRIDKRLGGGGSVIARPIGQLILAEFLSATLRQRAKIDDLDLNQWWQLAKQTQRDALKQFFKEVSTNLDDVPWNKLVWNPATRTITGGKKERRLVVNLLLDKFGLKSSIGRRQLLQDYRNLTQDRKMKLLSVDRPEDLANGDANDTDATSS